MSQEQARIEKVKKLKESMEPTHEPMLCKKSLELSSKGSRGDFLERQKDHALQRSRKGELLERKVRDRECTFKPRISAKGMEQRARSVDEMSTGDALKKEAIQEALRLRAEQHEMQGATFQPRILSTPGVEGRLKILSEPETYIARVQYEQMEHDRRMIEHQIQQEDEELAACTFQPEIHKAPGYVTRIAKSMALTRNEEHARKQPNTSGERGWR